MIGNNWNPEEQPPAPPQYQQQQPQASFFINQPRCLDQFSSEFNQLNIQSSSQEVHQEYDSNISNQVNPY